MATAALQRGDRVSPASCEELVDADGEQLLRDIAALEEVEKCSSLVLQELLQRQPPSSLPLHRQLLYSTNTPNCGAIIRTSSAAPPLEQSSSFPSQNLQQVGHHQRHPRHHHHPHSHLATAPSHHADPHPSPSHRHPTDQHTLSLYDAQHPCPHDQYRQHPSVRHAEVHPASWQELLGSTHHQLAAEAETPTSLLHQVMADCWTSSFSTGLMMPGASLDCVLPNSQGISTLPALYSAPPPSKKRSPVSALRKAKSASLNVTKKYPTLSAEYSHPHNDTRGTSISGKNPGKRMAAQAKTGISATHFLTERQRREFLNEKYQVLRSLIPNPTKVDRASIVQDAIDYVNELKEYADKLRSERGLADLKRRKVTGGGLDRATDNADAGSCKGGHDLSNTSNSSQEANTCTLSHKTSRYGTEVDVRVVANEATIKVTQHQSRRSFLLDAVLMLNEAELELLHANGARIGNFHVYILNVKIHESRSAHASQIARQLLDHIDASLKQDTSVSGTEA